jgi:hypothetical protein
VADRTNKLVTGDVFATSSPVCNFAKIEVLSNGRDVGVQWVTVRAGS